MPTIRHAVAADLDPVARLLARAFTDDPMMAEIFPDADARPGQLVAWFGAFLRHGLRTGHLYTNERAAALWVPPDVHLFDDAAVADIGAVLADALEPDHLARISAGLAEVGAGHPSDPPHFYLLFLGSDPAARGQGHGTALLADMLARCDAMGLPAYLEASSPRSRPLYERHGFEVTEALAFAGGPPIWRMWRDPRP